MQTTPRDGRLEFVVLAGLRPGQLLRGTLPRAAGDKKITIARRELLRRKIGTIEETA